MGADGPSSGALSVTRRIRDDFDILRRPQAPFGFLGKVLAPLIVACVAVQTGSVAAPVKGKANSFDDPPRIASLDPKFNNMKWKSIVNNFDRDSKGVQSHAFMGRSGWYRFTEERLSFSVPAEELEGIRHKPPGPRGKGLPNVAVPLPRESILASQAHALRKAAETRTIVDRGRRPLPTPVVWKDGMAEIYFCDHTKNRSNSMDNDPTDMTPASIEKALEHCVPDWGNFVHLGDFVPTLEQKQKFMFKDVPAPGGPAVEIDKS